VKGFANRFLTFFWPGAHRSDRTTSLVTLHACGHDDPAPAPAPTPARQRRDHHKRGEAALPEAGRPRWGHPHPQPNITRSPAVPIHHCCRLLHDAVQGVVQRHGVSLRVAPDGGLSGSRASPTPRKLPWDGGMTPGVAAEYPPINTKDRGRGGHVPGGSAGVLLRLASALATAFGGPPWRALVMRGPGCQPYTDLESLRIRPKYLRVPTLRRPAPLRRPAHTSPGRAWLPALH
jgi:hypothetical protein